MKLRITVDIFSGRENPVVELSGKEAQNAIERLQPAGKIARGEKGLPPVPTLGYRGLIIEQVDTTVKTLPQVFRLAHGNLFGAQLAHRVTDEAFEDYICGSTGPFKKTYDEKLPVFIKSEIVNFSELRQQWPWEKIVIKPPKIPVCPCAPLYEPAWWNDGGQKQLHNNCYNYACNYRADTFMVIAGGGQPGAASGAMYTALTCASVKPAAVKDGLIDSPNADNKCPAEGHLVALVMAPGYDFHWYRKGRDGKWTHKPGSTQVTNLDNSGAVISDPRTANRGPYTQFCTFMVVMHGHIKVK